MRVIYDPAQVRYDQLLRIFFSVVADPTLRDRQGPDRGTQYRAALIPVSAEQREVAAAYLAQMEQSRVWSRPVVTRIDPARQFFEAEAEHQDYFNRNPWSGYCRAVVAPKVAKFRKGFAHRLKERAA